MRLLRAEVVQDEGGKALALWLSVNGVVERIGLDLPLDWDTMDRPARIAWAKAQAQAHATGRIFEGAPLFPDMAAADGAKDDFEGMSGWATWTPAEAAAWIDTHVTDLPTAKQVLTKLATAVIHLRDIVIER
ncbi:MAG: hypothetical protein GWN58_27710 [Anaerolineae bacterium]|nr:hypothetical protein [Anaerolineae bacterium]